MKKATLSLEKKDRFKKAYKLIWKKATEPFSKMPEAKKINTLIEKTVLLQKIDKFIRKKPQNRLPKCLKPQETNANWKFYFSSFLTITWFWWLLFQIKNSN